MLKCVLPFPVEVDDDVRSGDRQGHKTYPSHWLSMRSTKMSERQKKTGETNPCCCEKNAHWNTLNRERERLKQSSDISSPVLLLQLTIGFASFEDNVYQAMVICDHTLWDYDENNYGVDFIRKLSAHFKQPLAYQWYPLEALILEFKQLKLIVGQRFRAFRNKLGLWKTLFMYHSGKHPQILLLMELCLVMAWSSSTVERGFSVCCKTFTDSETPDHHFQKMRGPTCCTFGSTSPY